MPRKTWIDKKSATTFALVHRPQNDPKIHDEEASPMVFKEVGAPNRKIKTRGDLEEELGFDPTSIRKNEGEAALHGVFYDDTGYDYMQHMRDLGTSLEGCFVEASQKQDTRNKGKGKQKLEDALRETHLDDDDLEINGVRPTDPKPLLDTDILPSDNLRPRTYQDQQDVPDALAGLQPNMDPRLREVLEALEDEAYVDDEEDIFVELSKESEEISLEEFEESGHADAMHDGEDLDDGWETDDTAKPSKEYKSDPEGTITREDVVMGDSSSEAANGNWMAEYGRFKNSEKIQHKATNADLPSSIVTGSAMSGVRHKKRKGAMTSSTGYSMTSSSLYRNEGLTLLDDRFDKIEREYAEDDDDDQDGGVSIAPSTSSSYNPASIRSDFGDMMDDFLGSYSMSGKKRVKRGGPQTGLEQLDEIRRGLGPAHIRSPKVTRII